MCQKTKKLWQCGHSDTEDPRRCRMAIIRNKASCQEYGFAWAFRDPVVEKWDEDCRSCDIARIERVKQDENKKFVERSQAYPRLRNVSAHDDETRQRSGKPRFDKSSSTSEITIPAGWTPAHNRMPCNANEYEQFIRGRFNPLQQLEDSYEPPQLRGSILYNGPRPLPAPATDPVMHQPRPSHFQPTRHAFTRPTRQLRTSSQGYRSRLPPPGYAVQIPKKAQISQFIISRHERAQITPPYHNDGPDVIPKSIIADPDDSSVDEFYDLNAGVDATTTVAGTAVAPSVNTAPAATPATAVQSHCHDRRRPSYTSNKASMGWIPPTPGPLPPKHETDTAPPSRSPSRDRLQTMTASCSLATSHSLP